MAINTTGSFTGVEICAYSAYSALQAFEGGASCIELCAGPYEGGTTPGHGTIRMVRKMVSIPLHIMVRPRGGDFLYSDLEFEVMKNEISGLKPLGVDGVVFGILDDGGAVDTTRCRELAELAYPLRLTFHRSFDLSADPFRSLEDIIALGFHRILTSGMSCTAYEGIPLLAKLVEAASDRISIMPGGGVNEQNVCEIIRRTGAREVHLSARSPVMSRMTRRHDTLQSTPQALPDDYRWFESDKNRVDHVVKLVASLNGPTPLLHHE